jgi:hypothetical protein
MKKTIANTRTAKQTMIDKLIALLSRESRHQDLDGTRIWEIGQIMKKDVTQFVKAEKFLVNYLNDRQHWMSGRAAAFSSLMLNQASLSEKADLATKAFMEEKPQAAMNGILVVMLENSPTMIVRPIAQQPKAKA